MICISNSIKKNVYYKIYIEFGKVRKPPEYIKYAKSQNIKMKTKSVII